jgi:hypothetical protein
MKLSHGEAAMPKLRINVARILARISNISRLALAIPLLANASIALAQTASITFYGSAHEDDWQLMMSPNAAYDVWDPSNKTVFIYFTAGDAGCGTGCNSPIDNVPYYRVREQAAMNSVRFAATVNLSQPLAAQTSSQVVINGHRILRYVLGPTVSYFLHLPDGNNVTGNGYPSTGNQSLQLLRAGQISSLKAIDGSASYTSWTDLVNTVTALIQAEANGSSNVWINTHDPDATVDPGDHPDHYATGAAMQAAVSHILCINQAYFTGYAKTSYPQNLDTQDSNVQVACFGAEVSYVVDYGFGSTFHSDGVFLNRDYFRVVSGGGSCTTSAVAADPVAAQRKASFAARLALAQANGRALQACSAAAAASGTSKSCTILVAPSAQSTDSRPRVTHGSGSAAWR